MTKHTLISGIALGVGSFLIGDGLIQSLGYIIFGVGISTSATSLILTSPKLESMLEDS